MTFNTIGTLFGLTLLTAGLATAKDSPDQKREKIRKMGIKEGEAKSGSL